MCGVRKVNALQAMYVKKKRHSLKYIYICVIHIITDHIIINYDVYQLLLLKRMQNIDNYLKNVVFFETIYNGDSKGRYRPKKGKTFFFHVHYLLIQLAGF